MARAGIESDLAYISRFGKETLEQVQLACSFLNQLRMETEADTDELAVHRELSIAREGFWRGRHGQSSCPEGVASRHRVFQIRVQIEVTMKVDKLRPHRVNSVSRLRHPATPPPRERRAETRRHSPPPRPAH